MWWRKKRRPAVERPAAEVLEPRIMYAADLGAGLLAAAAIDMPDAIEMRARADSRVGDQVVEGLGTARGAVVEIREAGHRDPTISGAFKR